jgi:predicted transcriptional regulator YdeE
MGIVALGGFATGLWVKYQRRSLKYHMELADNIYYRNINNNAGIFDYLIGTAEDQECKQALLTYHFIRKAAESPTIGEVATRVETWLSKSFKVKLDFEIADALKTLDRFGLVRREAERLFVMPLDQAIAQLREVWDNFFKEQQSAASQDRQSRAR